MGTFFTIVADLVRRNSIQINDIKHTSNEMCCSLREGMLPLIALLAAMPVSCTSVLVLHLARSKAGAWTKTTAYRSAVSGGLLCVKRSQEFFFALF